MTKKSSKKEITLEEFKVRFYVVKEILDNVEKKLASGRRVFPAEMATITRWVEELERDCDYLKAGSAKQT